MEQKPARELILDVLKTKACLKQEIYKLTLQAFNDLKSTAREITSDLDKNMSTAKEKVFIDFISKGDFEVRLKLGGDTLVFLMHTNIFQLDSNHAMRKTSYVKEDESRTYCGMINVYNFLSDSFKYNRINDLGYLIARIFINKDGHFFVEGKRQLGFLYNSFNSVLTTENLASIIESSILYSLDFDLLSPSYKHVQEISVNEIIEVGQINRIKTGKRLGFKFQADSTNIE